MLHPAHVSDSKPDINGRGCSASNARVRHSAEDSAYLKNWFVNHSKNPYPTDMEKEEIRFNTSLTREQIDTWFINARRRYPRKILPEQSVQDIRTAQKSPSNSFHSSSTTPSGLPSTMESWQMENQNQATWPQDPKLVLHGHHPSPHYGYDQSMSHPSTEFMGEMSHQVNQQYSHFDMGAFHSYPTQQYHY